MNRIICVAVLIVFAASPVMAKRFYFPGEKTEAQKKKPHRNDMKSASGKNLITST